VRTVGQWEWHAPNHLTVSFHNPARDDYRFEIVAVDATALRIRRLPRAEAGEESFLEGVREAAYQAFADFPPGESWRRVEFTQAEIITLESFPPQFVLRVSGIKPFANMDVMLSPLVYVRRPEYWGIEVVGRPWGPEQPTPTEYTARIPLSGVTGTEGVAVLGATRSELLKVPPDDVRLGECQQWAAWLDRQPPGPSTLHVRGACVFPSEGFTVELRRKEPQGINPKDLQLEKIVRPPDVFQPDGASSVTVSYEEEAAPGSFETVTILPEGTSVPVREVVVG
jgi:hypothetical protein